MHTKNHPEDKENNHYTDHFSHEEMACKCGRDCGARMDQEFMNALQWLRNDLKRPMVVTSGARCPEHNQAIGGAQRSRHLSHSLVKATAADILVSSSNHRYDLVRKALEHGFTGIGIGKDFVHLDKRPIHQARIWHYYHRGYL